MKAYKAYLAAVLVLSGASYATEWSPVFAHLEAGKKGNEQILNSIQVVKQNVNANTRDPLTANAKKGIYQSVPQPYRGDMLPTKAVKSKDFALQAVIPLKNATLYGYPLESLNEYYGCFECGDVGFFATFKPMTNKQYQDLVKKVKFKKVDHTRGIEGYGCGLEDGEPIAGFHKDAGKVHLVIYMGC